MKKALFFLLAATVAVFLLAAPRMVESSIPAAYYITPARKTYENVVSANGTVLAGEQREIYLSAPAVAAQVLVAEGETVRSGQLLARLDMEKTRTVASSTLGFAYDGATNSDLLEGVDLDGLLSLFGASALMGNGMDLSDLTGILGDIQGSYQAEVVATWLDSVEEEILSPISGVVTVVSISENVPVSAGRAILTIQDTSSYKVTATVSESDIAKVSVGDSVQVRCTGYASKQYTGVVTQIAPTARKQLSGTSTETVVEVDIQLLDGDSRLKPGFSARVDILCGDDYELLTVPYEAIRQDENNDEYVYVYEEGKVVKANVITGQELSSEVEVLHGISTDSIVVYNPGDLVREGAIINLKGRANVD